METESGDAVLTSSAHPRRPGGLCPGRRSAGGRYPARAAAARRDLAVEGFAVLRADIDDRGAVALRDFYDRVVALVSGRAPQWRALFERTTEQLTARTSAQIDAVAAGSAAHLTDGQVTVASTPMEQACGMCGMLRVPRVG